MKPILLAPLEIKPGDVVRINPKMGNEGSFPDHIVENVIIDGGKVQIKLFRPYMTCTDFTSTSGVITYIGHSSWVNYMRASDPEERWMQCREFSACAEVKKDRLQELKDDAQKRTMRLAYHQALWDSYNRWSDDLPFRRIQ